MEVDLVLGSAEGEFMDEVPADIRVVALGSARVPLAFPALVLYLRKRRPRNLISALDHANVAAVLGKRLARVNTKVLITIHGRNPKGPHFMAPTTYLTAALSRVCYHLADEIIAVSGGLADNVRTQADLSPRAVKVIPNPVATPELEERSREPPNHPWFASTGTPVVLSVARLSAEKDLTNLLRAFRVVRNAVDARLVILGEGNERPKLERTARQLHLAESVSMPGFQHNPYSFMSRSSVLVVSSKWEGFSNVLIEAMACGTNVVSTDCPFGPAEILENGRYGRLVPVGDPIALADAIVSAIRDPIRPELLHRRAQEFSIDRVASEYAALLQPVGGESGRRATR